MITSFMHPLDLHPVDSLTRLAWGKYSPDGALLKMPRNVQGHHSHMDRTHVGRFYESVQPYLHRPSAILGEA